MNPIPDQTRYAQKVATDNGYTFRILDKGENCIFRISKETRSFLAGSSSLDSYPLNNAVAASLAKDKIFTNHLLDNQEIPNLGGKCFFLSPDGRALRGEGYEIQDAFIFLESLDGPAFCKPLRGSKGSFAEIIRNAAELEDYIERCSKKSEAIIMQKYFLGTEYRVFMLGKEALFCIQKSSVELYGDGKSSAEELVAILNKELVSERISPYSENLEFFLESGDPVDPTYIAKVNEKIFLPGRKNICSGARPKLINPIPELLQSLALKSHNALGLEVSGIDFMCKEENGEILEARVIEVNANPAISSLEMLDRWDLIERVWLYVIEKGLGTRR